MADPNEVPDAVREIGRQLAEARPIRRGTLTERYQRCNKAGCACGDDPEARHGPYTSVVRVVKGRTQSRHVSAEQAAELRRQVEGGQKFRKQVEAYWGACEQWADARLASPEAASQEAAKKGGSNRTSKPRSSGKSKHS